MTKIYSQVADAIKIRYGSLSEPNYSFVGDSKNSRPHHKIKNKLSKSFSVQDVTDLNDDVSSRYLLEKGNKTWLLELSLVGDFAVLFRLNDNKCAGIVSSAEVGDELFVLDTLFEHGFEVLDIDLLEQPCALKLSNTARENVRIYQALFSDTDYLPWDDVPSE